MSVNGDDRRITRGQARKMSEGDNSKEEPASKKKKTVHKRENGKAKQEDKQSEEVNKPKKLVKCGSCCQMMGDLKYFQGSPTDALSECEMLISPKLNCQLDDLSDRPDLTVTNYSIYDEIGHLCRFDGGLMERGVSLYFSGYVKLSHDDDDDKISIPVNMIGPLIEWWSAGFDGSDGILGFSTELADYYLGKAASDYEPYIVECVTRAKLSKLLIEYLTEYPAATFDDVLDNIQNEDPQYRLEFLLHNSEFVINQITSYDSYADEDEIHILTTPCIRWLINLSGANLKSGKQAKAVRQPVVTQRKNKDAKPADTLATTTKLVYDILSTAFKEQLDTVNGLSTNNKSSKKGCGVCSACIREPCNECSGCRKRKKKCLKKICLRLAVQEADEDDVEDDCEDEMDEEAKLAKLEKSYHKLKERKTNVAWVGRPGKVISGKKYYDAMTVNGELVKKGDCVLVVPETEMPLYIAKVSYLYEDKDGSKQAHAHWFWRGNETILGNTSDKNEVFLSDNCDDIPAASIMYTCTVLHKTQPSNWKMIGGAETPQDDYVIGPNDDKERTFYYQKWYDYITARFQDPPEAVTLEGYKSCVSCQRKALLQKEKIDLVPCFSKPLYRNNKQQVFESFHIKGNEYSVGDCVFLSPDAYEFPAGKPNVDKIHTGHNNVNDVNYPERYRKTSEFIRGNNCDLPDPFCIARILSISAYVGAEPSANDGDIRVAVFFRPENTHEETNASHNSDFNLLYWTDEETTVSSSMIEGKCMITYADNIKCLDEYRLSGSFRFYFRQAYSAKKQCFVDVPAKAKEYGARIKNGKRSVCNDVGDYPAVGRKLRSLDIFAGCGGLSDGFHQAGVSETVWAVENDKNAAEAFKLNNPNCTVFNEDCNLLLKRAMEGHATDKNGQRLPKKGEVDLLLGGPPCQGFSGMNRFNSRQYSLFKNSLIASYLSYCDYYRPRFFVLENVRNFVAFKKSMVLKLVLSCLVRMGYQCTFAVLQAGHYGIPQTRRRAIILASAPGEMLPLYPEPLHVFNQRGSQLSVMVDDQKYVSNIQWMKSAPYRVVTVRDALSDLPSIKNGDNNYEISYGGPPLCHFQKTMRGNEKKLKDHVCKPMSNLVVERIRHIPCVPGSDWRDLPNISLCLDDGTIVKKLKYTHKDGKNGEGPKGELRGVCSCAPLGDKDACKPGDRQIDTLIPWCLPHTGNRHNNWAGLYGRLSWDGFFCTTVTNPEPMGKQGCVIHPDQHRVVSVRECARSQGFSDSYLFYGSILDRHRQIGNAVPPPLAAAIAMEFRKCLVHPESD